MRVAKSLLEDEWFRTFAANSEVVTSIQVEMRAYFVAAAAAATTTIVQNHKRFAFRLNIGITFLDRL